MQASFRHQRSHKYKRLKLYILVNIYIFYVVKYAGTKFSLAATLNVLPALCVCVFVDDSYVDCNILC